MKLKGAVIGYGFISSKGHVPAYLRRGVEKQNADIEIVALADICEARRALAQEALPKARIYSDFRALLQAEKDKLDFVDICTPPCDHAPIALEALRAGLHVLCEKPLTVTTSEAQVLLAEARKQRRVLFPCHNYKHAPVVKAIRQILESGEIGKVKSVTLSTFRNTHAKGVTEWKTHWRREKKYSGGGIAMDHGSHSFYLTFDWLGSYPTAITAKMSRLNPDFGRPGFETEDQFSAVLDFPTGEAHLYLSWNAGVRKMIYTLQGERGAIRVEDDELELALMKATTGPDVAQGAVKWEVERRILASDWMDASHVSWYNSLFDQFKRAIESDDFVGKEATEAYRCIEIINQAYESAKSRSAEVPIRGYPES